ncbi:MAG: nucleotide sugar dehydrogenase [Bacteroidia bacterium]|nr:nucleotide sugar dehydrogenase [Bacteroidia bacterium]NNM15240.1 nucleotide sugar dehydrogenase [Bacteroidia bacterium]
MYEKIKNKEAKIALIGLGYVGLPIALAFAKKASVIGFDIDQKRVEMMQKNVDPSGELDSSEFDGCDISFTSTLDDLKEANFYVVAVPTPIDEHKLPNLKPLLSAATTVGKVIKKGDYVVFESTVYPGCTEEDCIPVIEKESGLKFKTDFKVGYSPERINPGDKVHTLASVIKVAAGCCEESTNEIAQVYEMVVDAGVHRAPSIKVAEAAKIIENTQRDVNISLMNELSVIFNLLNINTYDVLEAANTKWNFLNFRPGLVGGHCIGVDPYYLIYKAQELGYHAHVINSGRYVNDTMAVYVVKETVKGLIAMDKDLAKCKVLIMGTTFKENVEDIRNSKVVDLLKEFVSYGVHVDVTDPRADSDELKKEYGFGLVDKVADDYDAIILAVRHKEYENYDENYFASICKEKAMFIDIKGLYKRQINKLKYWSL